MAVDFDVIVVGGGGAGFSAAAKVAEAGLSVMVIDADERPGGSTAMCGGVFYAAGTSLQREAGISDHPDAMYEYFMTLSQWNMEPGLARRFSDESAPTFEWLRKIGVEFLPENLYCAGVESVPRGHMAEGAGWELFQKLYQHAGSLGVQTVVNTRVQHLLRNEAGEVCGAHADGADVTAKAVIIASGGFGASPELLRKHFPTVARHGDWVFYIGNPHNRGDGLVMAQEVGAAVEGHDVGGINPSPNFKKKADAYLPGWLVIVNEDGRRFMDETAPYSVYDKLINRQPGHHCFAIMDEVARRNALPDADITDPLGLGDTMAYNWVGDTIAEQAEKGVVKKGDTLEALGAKAGINAEGLKATLENYNADVDFGTDRRFLKKFRPLAKVETPPFYAVELKVAQIGTTGSGIRIDFDACVLDEAGRRIPHLYAAGECTGGFYADRYLAAGASLGQALIWGRVAGETVVRDIQGEGK